MATIDKIIGITGLAFAAVVMLQGGQHWVVTVLLALAAATFVLFIPKPFKKRCITCGHFFRLTVWQKYFAKKGKRRCVNCVCSKQSVNNSDRVAAQ